MLQEAFELGERVRSWSVEVQPSGSSAWVPFAAGQVIGEAASRAGRGTYGRGVHERLRLWLTPVFFSLTLCKPRRLQDDQRQRDCDRGHRGAPEHQLVGGAAADPHLCRLQALPLVVEAKASVAFLFIRGSGSLEQ